MVRLSRSVFHRASLIQIITVRSRRTFAQRAKAAATQSETPADEKLSERPRRQRVSKRFETLELGNQWLETEGKVYDIAAPRNWLHPNRPFPKNPWFVPSVPVDDALREEIYQLYLSDPRQWVPRQLALKYQLSVLRIEAILRLKHLEKKQVSEGNVLQKSFRTSMEMMLGVGDEERLREDVDQGRPEAASWRASDRYQLDPDYEKNLMEKFQSEKLSDKTAIDSTVGGKDISADGKDPKKQELGFKRRSDGNYILQLSGVITQPEEPPTILEKENPRETNCRWKFIITDINDKVKDDERTVLVREHDGTLRTAMKAERRMQSRLYVLKQPQAYSTEKELWYV